MQAVEELTALDRTKSDFVSSVSHELRTPLASVLGYAEMLEDGAAGALTDRQLELVARVDRNGRRLLSLIEDLLLHSRIEAGRLELHPRRFDLAEVIDEAWHSVASVTGQRDLVRDLDVAPRPLWIEGDPVALERVVTNLLTNAVKFTPDGGRIGLTARVARRRRRRRRPGTVRLIVSDSGIGIPAADLDRVFTRFFRTSAANERAIQGSGLGLSIVRAIVEGHGGRVEVGRPRSRARPSPCACPHRVLRCRTRRARTVRSRPRTWFKSPGGLAPVTSARDGSAAVAGPRRAPDSARDDDDEGPGAVDALDPAQLDVARGRGPADEGQGTGGVEPRAAPRAPSARRSATVTTQTCMSGTRVIAGGRTRRCRRGRSCRSRRRQRRTRSRPRRRGPGRARSALPSSTTASRSG